jgi:hypothetical protein
MGYDEWLEKPYQDACAKQEAVEREIEEYSETDDFKNDAREWAVKNGLDLDAIDEYEQQYLESDDCYELCQHILERWN